MNFISKLHSRNLNLPLNVFFSIIVLLTIYENRTNLSRDNLIHKEYYSYIVYINIFKLGVCWLGVHMCLIP